jgi:Uma2 family endonuclease
MMTSFLTLDLSPVLTLTREQFYQICAANPEQKLERSPQGELIVMPPTGGETGYRNFRLGGELFVWNKVREEGIAFDSSTGFALPKGGDRSPDVEWIPLAKWEALTPEERRGFLPICPDFVIELLSQSDPWKVGQAEMEEYIQNGCRLGWLLDPKHKRVAIYRADQSIEILEAPEILSGEDVLHDFALNVNFLWE